MNFKNILNTKNKEVQNKEIQNEENKNEDLNEKIKGGEEKIKELLETTIKKHINENVIPIIIDLKRIAEFQKSSLLKDIMNLLKVIMSDYKSDIYVIDKQLSKEIEFDERKNDLQKNILKSPLKSKSPFKSPFKSPPPSKSLNFQNTPSKITPPKLRKRLFSDVDEN
jgi:hypothetical protein